MAWYWWVLVLIFAYFSLGFAYFPIFDQCVDRTRAQWLVKSLFYIFMLPGWLVLVIGGIAEMLMVNIKRNPGSIGCMRLQKTLFWVVFGLPLLWINVACGAGVGVLRILGIPDCYDDSPARHDA